MCPSSTGTTSPIVLDAFDNAFDCAVIISGDSDLRTPVDIVRSRFGKMVGVLNPQQKKCQKLQETATFYKHLRASALAASQFPDQLRDHRGAFHKPPSW